MNISLVIPFYEKHGAFNKVWKTLEKQLGPDDEAIVVDDHSPSGKPVGEGFRVIQPMRHWPHIYRLNTLRNHGIRAAKNDTVIILDPDCVPCNGFMETARRIHHLPVLSIGRIDFQDEKDKVMPDPRLGNGQTRFCDLANVSSGMVWGGCMMFSRSRTRLLGWFDEAYDGAWGAEDHDFGSLCFHSGMRLRYVNELRVTHLWHPPNPAKTLQEYERRNLALWRKRIGEYRQWLDRETEWRPRLAVVVCTMHRPELLGQCLTQVFASRIPVKVLLTNQGDKSAAQKEALNWWRERWSVEITDNDSALPVPVVRNAGMKRALELDYDYALTLDDDVLLHQGAIEKLFSLAEKHPEYHVIAGSIVDPNTGERMLGGYLVDVSSLGTKMHFDLPLKPGVHPVDYVSTGFTLIRLKPLTLFDEDYIFGWDDWDWANTLRAHDLGMAVTGDAVGYHKYLSTSKGLKQYKDSREYSAIRYDEARNNRMADLYEKKWGYRPEPPRLWRRSLRA